MHKVQMDACAISMLLYGFGSVQEGNPLACILSSCIVQISVMLVYTLQGICMLVYIAPLMHIAERFSDWFNTPLLDNTLN